MSFFKLDQIKNSMYLEKELEDINSELLEKKITGSTNINKKKIDKKVEIKKKVIFLK